MLSVQVEREEVARAPASSRALLSLSHDSWCTPTPLTGIAAVAAGYHLAGASSSEQAIPATPLGPAVAVAWIY